MAFPKAKPLSEEQIERVRDLRATKGKGRDWRTIARTLGVREIAVLRVFAPSEAERRTGPTKREFKFLTANDFGCKPGPSVCVPDLVLAERDRVMMLAPRDLTAALMGDPLPTRSALDRRGS